MKQAIILLLSILVFSSVTLKNLAYSDDNNATSHIKPVIIYSETEQYLRNKWSAYAIPQRDTREVLKEDSYAVWFTPEVAEAWYMNRAQQNLWTRWDKWKAKGKINNAGDSSLQFQFYLKGNPEELRLNEEELYDIKVFLGDDRGNVYEPVKIEKGPLDELVHNNFYQFTAYFSAIDPETLGKIVDKETKFVKVALNVRDSRYFFKWDLK